ncbi:MAG: secretin and TonB N-terminal domain-containing protein [Candidatus Omnitrophica bacterium]|nr:secretin and TonB N-terminal domain-containing protein [Candidatus Omnitrophota bacterium]
MKMKWIKLWPVCGLLAGVLFLSFYIALNHSVSQAQEESEGLAQALPLPSKTEAGNITVDFKDADIRDVLKIISYKSGINIVSGKDVSGVVTIRLADVPWERALNVILKNSGFVYERDEDIIRVTTVENLGKEELSTQIFVLNYAKAEGVSETIKEILSDRGKVKFDERTNQLVVTDVPSNLYKISKVVEKLDKKTAQVMIEAKLIETTLDKDENLGIKWTLGGEASGSSRKITAPFVFGNTGGITGKKYFPKVNQTGDFAGSVENGFPYAVKSDFTFGTLNFTQLQAALEILKERKDTKILSNPRITTLNNQEAVIGVTETLNMPTYEVDSDTGRLVVSGYTEKDVGVKLTVTPHVNPEGYIVVELHPEVSSLKANWDSFDTGSGTITAPRFSTREAITQVMIKDGETIVIGGLIKEETTNHVWKIPLLGDLPLLKYLFSKTEKAVETTDLIIFVTVRLLESESLDLEKQAKLDE